MAISRWARLFLFVAGFVGLMLYVILRSLSPTEIAGPTIVLAGPQEVKISLRDLKSLPHIEQEGSYQNQYGNWRDQGIYRGVPVPVLLEQYFPGVQVRGITVIGADGYQIEIGEEKLFHPDYPVVLAYAFAGLECPAWADGPRIAVLPEDGGVANEEYGVESAGSFWVKNVVRIVIHTL